jgi:hypothetical protein
VIVLAEQENNDLELRSRPKVVGMLHVQPIVTLKTTSHYEHEFLLEFQSYRFVKVA